MLRAAYSAPATVAAQLERSAKNNMAKPTQNQIDFITESWKSRWDGVISSQNQALNWLFTMNTGGVAGILAYAAAKDGVSTIVFALIAFSSGLLALIGYAGCMYYAEERMHNAFRLDIEEFYREVIDWDEFMRRDNARPSKYRICEVLAWISAISGGVGIVFSSYAIL
jgi:hypothetical protein